MAGPLRVLKLRLPQSAGYGSIVMGSDGLVLFVMS